jgi:hypothetical protein
MNKKKVVKRSVIGVLIAAALAVGFSFTPQGAQAKALITGKDIKDQSIESRDIAAGGVAASEVRNRSLTGTEFKQSTVDRFLAGERALDKIEQEKAGWSRDTIGATYTEYFTGSENVAKIGGGFVANHTEVGTFTLPAGEYMVTSEGFFLNNAATSGKTRMQVAIRGESGQDYGTCFTGAISTLANRESHCSATRVIDVPASGTTVTVNVFGYADDQGSADGGKVDADTFVTVVPVTKVD